MWVETAAARKLQAEDRTSYPSASAAFCRTVDCFCLLLDFVCFRALTSKFCCHWPNPGHFFSSFSPSFSISLWAHVCLVCMQVLKSLINAQRQKSTLQGMRGQCFSTGLNRFFEMANGWFVVHEKWGKIAYFSSCSPCWDPILCMIPRQNYFLQEMCQVLCDCSELYGCLCEKWLPVAAPISAHWVSAGRGC